MAKRTTQGLTKGDSVKIAKINEILARIEWELRVARALLHELGPDSSIKLTDEIRALLKQEPRSVKDFPC